LRSALSVPRPNENPAGYHQTLKITTIQLKAPGTFEEGSPRRPKASRRMDEERPL